VLTRSWRHGGDGAKKEKTRKRRFLTGSRRHGGDGARKGQSTRGHLEAPGAHPACLHAVEDVRPGGGGGARPNERRAASFIFRVLSGAGFEPGDLVDGREPERQRRLEAESRGGEARGRREGRAVRHERRGDHVVQLPHEELRVRRGRDACVPDTPAPSAAACQTHPRDARRAGRGRGSATFQLVDDRRCLEDGREQLAALPRVERPHPTHQVPKLLRLPRRAAPLSARPTPLHRRHAAVGSVRSRWRCRSCWCCWVVGAVSAPARR
jgi:hypothetical protein